MQTRREAVLSHDKDLTLCLPSILRGTSPSFVFIVDKRGSGKWTEGAVDMAHPRAAHAFRPSTPVSTTPWLAHGAIVPSILAVNSGI